MNQNLESLKDYLANQLNETNQSLRLFEIERKNADGEEIYQRLLFRKGWLQIQLDNIYINQSENL